MHAEGGRSQLARGRDTLCYPDKESSCKPTAHILTTVCSKGLLSQGQISASEGTEGSLTLFSASLKRTNPLTYLCLNLIFLLDYWIISCSQGEMVETHPVSPKTYLHRASHTFPFKPHRQASHRESLHWGSELWENIHLGLSRDHECALFVSPSRNADWLNFSLKTIHVKAQLS